MKRPLHRLIALIALLALSGLAIGYTRGNAQQFLNELPLDKKVPPGVTYVTYVGQNLRFTTQYQLTVRLEVLDPTHVKLEFSAATGTTVPPGAKVQIYWMNVGAGVYDGDIPPLTLPEGVVLDTEGGFVDR